MKTVFANSALNDLDDIKDYYLEQGVPHIGEDFVVAIFEHIDTLVDHPDIGRVVPEFEEEYIRELIHRPFRIVYLRETKVIQIIRIWRSERLLNLPNDEA